MYKSEKFVVAWCHDNFKALVWVINYKFLNMSRYSIVMTKKCFILGDLTLLSEIFLSAFPSEEKIRFYACSAACPSVKVQIQIDRFFKMIVFSKWPLIKKSQNVLKFGVPLQNNNFTSTFYFTRGVPIFHRPIFICVNNTPDQSIFMTKIKWIFYYITHPNKVGLYT